MPTNEERREAAAWIRNGAHDIDINGYIKLAINVVDRGDGATWGQLALKLADLIEPEPKRTCRKVPGRMRYGERKPKCSECGYSLGDPRWFYCPKCGGKITNDRSDT